MGDVGNEHQEPRTPSIAGWFDLTTDQAPPAEIDSSIRSAAVFRGTNLWILICATFVASIGLNVNSAAVIIGAMLISPLMGPIIAIGYGAAINDFRLIRTAAINLGVAVAFSLATSTLYFFITPLSGAGSELLARTSPAIWDVLIAVFGGLAGIIGATRHSKGNVVPGVAIATALMPPLCTAGYGIAHGQPFYTLGALYLFTINSVFIATAALLMVRVMRLPELEVLDEATRTRTRRYIGAVVLLTGVPSIYLAGSLVQNEVFISRADRFIAAELRPELGTFVVAREASPDDNAIRVTLIGDEISDERRFALQASLAAYGLDGTRLELIQSKRDEVDVESLRQQVTGDLYQDTLIALDEKSRRIAALEQQLAADETADARFEDIGAELHASYPQATHVAVGLASAWGVDGATQVLLVAMTLDSPLSDEEEARLSGWLAVRARIDTVQLAITVAPSPSSESPARGGR